MLPGRGLILPQNEWTGNPQDIKSLPCFNPKGWNKGDYSFYIRGT